MRPQISWRNFLFKVSYSMKIVINRTLTSSGLFICPSLGQFHTFINTFTISSLDILRTVLCHFGGSVFASALLILILFLWCQQLAGRVLLRSYSGHKFSAIYFRISMWTSCDCRHFLNSNWRIGQLITLNTRRILDVLFSTWESIERTNRSTYCNLTSPPFWIDNVKQGCVNISAYRKRCSMSYPYRTKLYNIL